MRRSRYLKHKRRHRQKKPEAPDTCETVLSKLNDVFAQIQARKGDNGVIVLIGAGAKGENASVNLLRLDQVVAYLTARKINSENIVQGIGRQKKMDLGYLRFYVRGEFIEEIKIRKSHKVCLDVGA